MTTDARPASQPDEPGVPGAPESIEDYYARVLEATDAQRRLPVAVEAMPGWDIFPYELDSLRVKPLQPLLATEPDRAGEDPATCWCADAAPPRRICWADQRWQLRALDSGLPVMLLLQPRAHHDLADLPEDLAAELGRLLVVIGAAVQALPSVGRAHIGRYGDGGAHLHVFFFGRPARVGQFRGSPLLDWEENLPRVPPEVRDANAWFVAARVAAAYGGQVLPPTPRADPPG